MTVTSQHRLELGDLDLTAGSAGIESYKFDVLAEGFTLGSPEGVKEIVRSLLVDGDLTKRTRHGNRRVPFRVVISGADLQAVADGEAALAQELLRVANTLTWTPPDGFGPPSVFTMVDASIEEQFDDLDQLLRTQRIFAVELECLPYTRSVTPVTIEWTGPQNRNGNVLANWTLVSGTAEQRTAGYYDAKSIRTYTNARLRMQIKARGYAWLVCARSGSSARALESVTVNGTLIPDGLIRLQLQTDGVNYQVYTVDTRAWRGQTVNFDVTLQSGQTSPGAPYAEMHALWLRDYPAAVALARPSAGIDVIDVPGSARAPFTLQFTAPASGAWVYAGPDPDEAIRRRGAGESVFQSFTVTDADGEERTVAGRTMWFPQGTHATNVGWTDPQVEVLAPADGMWPQIVSGANQWAYPADSDARVTYYATGGSKTLISPTPFLPQGYHPGAAFHEPPVLYPGRCGFAVLGMDGTPIPATITFHPHWWTNAATR